MKGWSGVAGTDPPVRLLSWLFLGKIWKQEEKATAGGLYWGRREVRQNEPHTIFTGSKRKPTLLTVVLEPVPSLSRASVSPSEK